MDQGFIKLNRKFFSHRMWEAARTFSECEAWIDLIQSARFEATVTIERIGGREIKYGRGQYPASNRYLARKWGWGEQKVKTFMRKLRTDKMIEVEKSQGMNIVTLCKYDVYNGHNSDDISPESPSMVLVIRELSDVKTQPVTRSLTCDQPTDNPNFKKEKKEEERITISPYSPPREYEKINFDFLDTRLREHFFQWLDYKTSKGQMYKNRRSIELCYKRLIVKSQGDCGVAVAIIEQSMANNWNGLFDLQQHKDANSNKLTNGYPKQSDYTIGM